MRQQEKGTDREREVLASRWLVNARPLRDMGASGCVYRAPLIKNTEGLLTLTCCI